MAENKREFDLNSSSSQDQFGKNLDQTKLQTVAQKNSSDAAETASKAAQALSTTNDQQLEILRRQLELTGRPWIRLTGIEVPKSNDVPIPSLFFTPDLEGVVAHFGFVPTLKNVGQSPALAVQVFSELLVLHASNDFDTMPLEQQRFCSAIQNGKVATNQTGGKAIFPDDVSSPFARPPSSAPIGNYDINDLGPGGKKAFVVIELIGCIDYRFQASSTHHQTRFAYKIGRKDVQVGWPYLDIRKSVYPEDIRLDHQEQLDYAD